MSLDARAFLERAAESHRVRRDHTFRNGYAFGLVVGVLACYVAHYFGLWHR